LETWEAAGIKVRADQWIVEISRELGKAVKAGKGNGVLQILPGEVVNAAFWKRPASRSKPNTGVSES
jgi:hypothetical protein